MNGKQLEEIIEKFPSLSNYFLGVFSIDTLPKTIYEKNFLFCNTDLSSQPGSHWICFLKQNKKSVECFDSLGINSAKKDLLVNFCPFKQIKLNYTQFQSEESISCGKFVLYFALNRMFNLDLSFNEFLKEYFVNDVDENLKKVNDFFILNEIIF